jgi:hypothetical protein
MILRSKTGKMKLESINPAWIGRNGIKQLTEINPLPEMIATQR